MSAPPRSQYGGALPYGYSWAPTRPASGQVTTSRTEIVQIAVAYLVLTFDLVLLLSGGGLLFTGGTAQLGFVATPAIIVVAAAAALTGFVLHEMAHKIVAQRRGYWAEFRFSIIGLAISVFTAIFGFLFAAPGATVVGGMNNPEEWGRTAIAGPSLNLVFGATFYVAALATFAAGAPAFVWLLLLAFINCWFAAFNLIPFGVLDGAKVMHWSKAIWGGIFVLAAALAVVCWLALFWYGTPLL
jgi:Zn-dependent protease